MQTPTTSEKLWADYTADPSPAAREGLITRYIRLARYVVERLNVRETPGIGRDDLISHAILGLIDAIERFVPERGVKFETYALPRIRGSVVDFLRSQDWAPRSLRRTQADVKRAYATLESVLGRPAPDEEVAAELGLDLDAFHDTLREIAQTTVFSLEDAVPGEARGEAPLKLGEILDGPPDPAALAEVEERKRLLADAVGALPERERLVVGLYYYEGLTLKEIGCVLDVTEARVCQIHAKAMLRLGGKLERLRSVLCC